MSAPGECHFEPGALRMRAHSVGLALGLYLIASPAHSAEKCQLLTYAEMHVTMVGTQPLIAGSINGVEAWFMADSGAFFSTLSAQSAAKFHLTFESREAIKLQGMTDAIYGRVATVKDFSLAGFGTKPLHNVEFIVAGYGIGGTADGLIGQNVIGYADTEYDLANGVIRLMVPKGCGNQMLAYWHGSADVAEMETAYRTPLLPHILGSGTLNGKKIRILFDTGAGRSILTIKAAARAGVKTDSAGVEAGGASRGIGRQQLETWLARFDRLELGGEQIHNARLRIGDIDLPGGADLLLGEDFFLSHRIYVAAKQHRIYFTYNGGRVFDLNTANEPAEQGASTRDVPPEAAGPDTMPEAPTDAATFRRRGAALVGRRQFTDAIADFDKAIALEPADAENFYLRGMARWENGQAVLAMDDFNQALKIKPDHIMALMGRGALRLFNSDEAGARTDFAAVAALAPKDAGLELQVAHRYEQARRYDEAIRRLDAWTAAYPKDDRLPFALNSRCWARAMIGKDLDLALSDCSAALAGGGRIAEVLDSRGLVWLRLGNFDKAMADYREALKLQPKIAWSLYGLGIAQLRKGMTSEGETNIQAATAISPRLADEFKRMGLSP